MLFVSKIRDLRLVRRPADRIMDEHRNPIILKGERVEFSNFRFTTSDPDLIEWLVNHEMYGSTFTSDKMKDKPMKKLNTGREAIDAARALIRDYDGDTVQPEKQFEQAIQKKDKKPKIELPAMVKGMMATVQAAHVQEKADKRMIEDKVVKVPITTKEEIADMIKTEINSAMAQVVDLIKATSKKKFHCKECGEEFNTGIEVGAHKKIAHAKPTEMIGPIAEPATPEVTS